MDDILFSAPSVIETQQMFDIAQQYLKDSGLIIAPEKIQTSTPYYYLRFVVNRQRITPQLTQIRVNKLLTLNDFQKLFSSVQFSRAVVSNSLQPHESQHARPPYPSPTPGVHSDSRPSSQ